jgi:hypothetical protein
VAKLTDVPLKHRERAGRVPAETLEALCPHELRSRVARAADLEEVGQWLPPQDADTFLTLAAKVLESEPVWDFVQRQHELARLMNELGRDALSDVAAVRTKHADQNEYPPGLVDAIDAVLRNAAPDPIMADLAELIRAHHER